MLKKLSTLLMVGLLAVPTIALADSMEDRVAALEESSESWDKASRIHWSGDFRFRTDYINASAPEQYSALDVSNVIAGLGPWTSTNDVFAALPGMLAGTTAAMRNGMFIGAGLVSIPADEYENVTNYTNRLRLNMRTKVMENVEVKARLAMYKTWGMQSSANEFGGPFTLSSLAFDGSATRMAQDSVVRVDRAFMNWNNIGDMPIWFSVGRRPVTDGPPAQLRMGVKKMATPVAYMDYAFDGLSLGYAYENLFGIEDMPGRFRFCYGRGFEAGAISENAGGLSDVDFGGISWDVFHTAHRFFNFQSFGAWNMFNTPEGVVFPNPLEYALYTNSNITYDPMVSSQNLELDRANLGDIYHTSAVYMADAQTLHYFVATGWSHTVARGMDEMGTSLLGSWGATPEDQDGYNLYAGIRYDLDDAGWKLGGEVNWGSEYWISFTPGHDDLYASKLATRGTVLELYGIYDLPAGDAISTLSKAFMRIGYQHYEYDYTGSGYWLGTPADIDELALDPLNAQLYPAVDSADQIYLTFEAWF